MVIWKIDRLGRNLRDLVDIVTTLGEREVGVKSLTIGIVDAITPHGTLVFGMFALMTEHEAAPFREMHPGRAEVTERSPENLSRVATAVSYPKTS